MIISLFSHKKLLLVCGIIVSVILIGIYIVQVNYVTQLAYHTAQTQEELIQLQYGNATLQAQTFQAASLKDLALIASANGFEKIDKITYVRAGALPVAQQ